MKTLYLECGMGAAGDMLTAALYELLDDRQGFLDTMNALGLPGIRVEAQDCVKCGIHGTRLHVLIDGQEEEAAPRFSPLHPHEEAPEHHHGHNAAGHHHDPHDHHHGHDAAGHHHAPHEHPHEHHHEHFTYASVCGLIDSLPLPEDVRQHAREAYRLIGEAESHAHGAPIDQIHFHEVGSLDAVADVVGFFLALHLLAPEQVIASPVRVGWGNVRCAHGILPVPAPATAHILQGIPCYAGDIEGEMCTPTGAALLKSSVSVFQTMPVLRIGKVGYGMGGRDFPAANCVRAFWGESSSEESKTDEVAELSCNLDDMSPEAIGYAVRLLQKEGALDVYTTPIQMKKNRPAVLLTVLCTPEKKNAFSRLILQHTTTRGVRYKFCQRYKLSCRFENVHTVYGDIRVKISEGWDVFRCKPEFDDVAAAAQHASVPFDTVFQAALDTFRREKL